MPEGIWSDYPIQVVWEGGQRFRAGRPGGPTLLLDGAREAAPGPVDGLVAAIAACAATDVVEILEKRRTPAASLEVRVEFARAVGPPRRLTAARLLFRVATASEAAHVERAVALTIEKYCSVASSLAPDVDLSWSVELAAPDAPGTPG